MSEPDFFPNRVRPLEDSLIGLDRGLRRIGCLLRAAVMPCLTYAVIMAAMNQVYASHSLPYFVAFAKSPMEWWYGGIVFVPFSAVLAWTMLHCLLSRAPRQGLLPVGSVPTAVYGLAAAWIAANWLSVVAVDGLTWQLLAPYVGVRDHEELAWITLHAPRLIELALGVAIAAAAAYLVATAAVAALPSTPRYRALVAAVAAALLVVLAVDVLRVHGGALTEGAARELLDSVGRLLTAGVGLLMLVLIAVVFRAGTFRFSAAHALRSGGWRLALLLLIAAGLTNGAVFALDAFLRWANLTDIRIDDPFWRQEFAVRALAHHAIICLRDVVFYLVLLSVTAQGFRRVLGAAAADPVAGRDDAIGAEAPAVP
jgi:hypothetical protein